MQVTGMSCTCTVRQLNLEIVLTKPALPHKRWRHLQDLKTKGSFSLQAPLEPGLCNYRYCRWWKAEGTIYFFGGRPKVLTWI